MKCHILFSERNKKSISKCRLLKILPRVLSVKYQCAQRIPCSLLTANTKYPGAEVVIEAQNIGDHLNFIFTQFYFHYSRDEGWGWRAFKRSYPQTRVSSYPSKYPCGTVFSRAVMDRKSLYPLFYVDGGSGYK